MKESDLHGILATEPQGRLVWGLGVPALDMGGGTVTEKMGLREPLLKYGGEKGGLCQVRAFFWY